MEARDNARTMAAHSVPDGLKMLWRDIDAGQFQNRQNIIRTVLLDKLGLSAADVKKGMKFKVLRGAAEREGSLYAMELSGACARAMYHLPWWMLRTATKLHFKTYAEEARPAAADSFAEALFRSSGHVQASFFNNAQNGRNAKNSGTKGSRLGSRKADSQTTIYGRQRERVGIETRVEDKLCRKCVNEVDLLELDKDTPEHDNLRAKWLHRKAAHVGFVKFLAECRRRGINVADYFSHVTAVAAGAVGGDELAPLDYNEEASFMPPA